jgi:hypothetical protein
VCRLWWSSTTIPVPIRRGGNRSRPNPPNVRLPLPTANEFEFCATWSPDGNWLAYSRWWGHAGVAEGAAWKWRGSGQGGADLCQPRPAGQPARLTTTRQARYLVGRLHHGSAVQFAGSGMGVPRSRASLGASVRKLFRLEVVLFVQIARERAARFCSR